MDSVHILMGIEDAFGVRISDGDASACRTPGDIVGVTCRVLSETGREWPQGSGKVDRAEVVAKVRTLLCRVLVVPLEEVTLDADLVRDLGLS